MAWYNPDDPQQRNYMLFGIIALAAIYPYSAFLLAPRKEANAEIQQRVEQLEVVNRRASVLTAQGGGDLEERLALYQRHVDRLEELIPASDEVPVLLDDINARARLARVDVQALDPEPPQPTGPYDLRAYNMAVVGEYHAVGRFLTDIANLSRIVTPVQVDLEVFQNTNLYPDMVSPVRATFRIETYVFANRPAAPAPAGAGGQ